MSGLAHPRRSAGRLAVAAVAVAGTRAEPAARARPQTSVEADSQRTPFQRRGDRARPPATHGRSWRWIAPSGPRLEAMAVAGRLAPPRRCPRASDVAPGRCGGRRPASRSRDRRCRLPILAPPVCRCRGGHAARSGRRAGHPVDRSGPRPGQLGGDSAARRGGDGCGGRAGAVRRAGGCSGGAGSVVIGSACSRRLPRSCSIPCSTLHAASRGPHPHRRARSRLRGGRQRRRDLLDRRQPPDRPRPTPTSTGLGPTKRVVLSTPC